MDQPLYHYIIEKVDVDTVQRFYRNEMQAAGWEILGVGDMSAADTGKAYVFWFAKDQDIVTIDIFVKENVTHVVIRFE